jgi:hypothetical protein
MICSDEIDYNRISSKAASSSKKFSSSVFEKNLLELIGEEIKRL